MKIVISGSHGLIGMALVEALKQDGHEIRRLVRTQATGAGEIFWDPEGGEIDGDRLEGTDAVVHLAGENLAAHRWTGAIKARIRDSRVKGTRLLSETLAARKQAPKVMICASAIGIYGDRGVAVLDEGSSSGSGYLKEVCEQWEAACDPVQEAHIRLVTLRIGIVLSEQGGALKKMLPPFKMGVAGPIGNGKQYMSWIALDDVIGIIRYALENESIKGPLNLVAPEPVTNHDFSKMLGHVLHRPAILPMPAFAARLAFGEMADELLLSSSRVRPSRLLAAGYQFKYPTLNEALVHILQESH